MTRKNPPVLIELDQDSNTTPANAPPVPDLQAEGPRGPAIETLAVLAAKRPRFLARLFWAAALVLVAAVVSVAAWDFVFGLLARNVWLGRSVLVVLVVFLAALLGISLREWLALVRLRRVDRLKRDIEQVTATPELVAAERVLAELLQFYARRDDLAWARQNLLARRGEILDGDGILHLAEAELMTPLDAAARREVEAAARQVATVTAIVPLALADVAVALAANLRMVRRVAVIYGGRGGMFGSWRLLRTVMLHLVATGALAVGDDLIGTIAGGGVVSKLSRRFGEGIVNGALTARVGVAAMEVCRPMPFGTGKRPRVSRLVSGALTGLFGKG